MDDTEQQTAVEGLERPPGASSDKPASTRTAKAEVSIEELWATVGDRMPTQGRNSNE
jgi:hypothetical protein